MNGTHRARRRTAALLLGFFAAALLDAAPARAAEEPVRELIAVGQPIGVKLFSDGVLVIGFSDGDTAAKACGLKEGDIITALGGESLDTIEELRACLNANGGSDAELTVKRGSRTLTLEALPRRDESGEYRLGAWVRDSMAGIGTMTFYDPQSGTFGALGHGVTDVDTGKLLPLDHGSIMNASVKAVKKGEHGAPGELKGAFDFARDSGTLYANTESGIFGKLSAQDAAALGGKAYSIAARDEVKTGSATILATVNGNETKEYAIESVCGVRQKCQNSFLTVSGKCCQIRTFALWRCKVYFKVACGYNGAGPTFNSQSHRIRDRVVYMDRHNRHTAHVYSVTGFHNPYVNSR